MNSHYAQKKFQAHQEEVETLLEKNSRFNRIYKEYDHLQGELYHLENAEGAVLTDDFMNYLKVQTLYLEEQIEEFLTPFAPTKPA